MSTPSWESLCSANELAFRAACNAGAPAESRPVKERVIKRIAKHEEARAVFEQAWKWATTSESAAPADTARKFYEFVSANPMWSTLVMEQVAAEIEWKDPFSWDGLQTFVDRGVAFFGKFSNRKEHPAAATATQIAIAVTGLWTVNLAFPDQFEAITLPIRVAFIGDEGKLAVNFMPQLVDGKPVDIPFTMSGTGESRMKVTFDSEPMEIRFAVDEKGNGSPTVALGALADELRRTNETLVLTADRMQTLANSTSRLDSAPLKTLTSIRDSVEALHAAYAANSKAEAEAATLRVNLMTNELQRLGTVSVPPFQKVTLHANSSESFVLSTSNKKTGEPEFSFLKVCTGSVGTDQIGDYITLDARISKTNDAAHSKCGEVRAKRYEGSELPVSPEWNITFSSIHRRWYGSGDVTASIRPMAAKVSVAQQSASEVR